MKVDSEFKDKIEYFKYLRQERVSYYQGIYIALFVASIVLFVDLIAKEDIILKIIFIIGFIIIAQIIYKKSLTQTQKPIFVCKNLSATVEKGPEIIKSKGGEEYAVFKISDITHKK